MNDRLWQRMNELVTRHYLMVVAFAIALPVAIVILVAAHTAVPEVGVEPERPAELVRGPILPAADPVNLRIPALDLIAPFEEPLRVDANREIEVPEAYDTVAYYEYGPTPGELGPAVVLGHVDSVDGPAVFYSLGQLSPGDEIIIERSDGSVATFVVTALERHLQAGFPTEQVYGDIDHAGLRLITCSGTFDQGEQRYSHNLIVFAELTA